jgi:hypothetical protein
MRLFVRGIFDEWLIPLGNVDHRTRDLGMSRRHEPKHLLHNWSDCRYRDRPQNPRAVLRVRLAGCNCQ